MSYRDLCTWCYNMPMMEQCKCTEPCGRNNCPMLDDGHLFPPAQPVPTFQKREEEA